ncbi:MAG: DegQ family serine endoprotease [Alphaproteobacteria bacterium]
MKKNVFTFVILVVSSLCFSFRTQAATPDSFADLAEKLIPSVVNISTSQKVTAPAQQQLDLQSLFPNSPLEEFFKDFFEKGAPGMPKGGKVTSLGSGFVIDESGLILTNYHVVEKAEKISVIFDDKTSVDAELLARDKKTDIALLKIKTDKKLHPVVFGDSDAMRIGDWILAIGNPFGLGNTVTAGIISARGRDIQTGPYDDYLQTDASINRGNSGGPMFNINGEVVGINTAIFSPSGGSVGIGFAIPSNIVKWVVNNLKTNGHITRGWIGVTIQTVSDDIAESIGMSKAMGALVAAVNTDGPAQKTGLKVGDIITEFNGKTIDEMRVLPRIVAETAVGTQADIKVMRAGKEISLKIEVGEMPEDESENQIDENQISSDDINTDNGKKLPELSMTVETVTPETINKYDLPEAAQGVVISSIDDDSDAMMKGLMRGDVIVEVNQNKVNSAEDIAKELETVKKANRTSVLLLIDSKDGMRFVAVKLQ